MKIEYEATFANVDKDETRKHLENAGAALVKPEFLQKRATYKFPKGHEVEGGWLRVRDEGDKITMSLKIINGEKIEDQKEIELTVDDFDEAKNFLILVGCTQKSYQETRRELWRLDGVDITIDEWPFLEPLVEVEGDSEEAVRSVSEKIGFDYAQAKFCAVGTLYNEKYGISLQRINNETPLIVFDMANPFVDSDLLD